MKPGDMLAGKYRVERVLGAGGMGVVVAATQVDLDRLVALKFVLPEMARDAESVERFLREARAAVRLRSEHVAKVLDVGKLEDGAPYMVMEYLEGADLDSVVAREGPLSIQRACECVLQACEALAEAHAKGLVHRDLKPHNLFLTVGVGDRPVVKVLDFGISKFISGQDKDVALTRTSAVLGSPLYMSPEQMRGARLADARSDIWSLGVILYHLLTAKLPFEGESITELALKVAQDPPVPIGPRRSDLPAALREVVERCLQKDPAARFKDAGELATALVPFAPPYAARLAESARLALSSKSGPISLPSSVASSPQLALAPTEAIVGTKSAWGGSAPAATAGGPAARSRSLWYAVGAVVVVGGAAAAVVATRSGGTSTASPTSSSTPRTTEPTTTTTVPTLTAASASPTPNPTPTTVDTTTATTPTAVTTKPSKPNVKIAPPVASSAIAPPKPSPSTPPPPPPPSGTSTGLSPDDLPKVR